MIPYRFCYYFSSSNKYMTHKYIYKSLIFCNLSMMVPALNNVIGIRQIIVFYSSHNKLQILIDNLVGLSNKLDCLMIRSIHYKYTLRHPIILHRFELMSSIYIYRVVLILFAPWADNICSAPTKKINPFFNCLAIFFYLWNIVKITDCDDTLF